MMRFMLWLGFMPLSLYVPPVPGRSGRSVWEELSEELELPPDADWTIPFGWEDAA